MLSFPPFFSSASSSREHRLLRKVGLGSAPDVQLPPFAGTLALNFLRTERTKEELDSALTMLDHQFKDAPAERRSVLMTSLLDRMNLRALNERERGVISQNLQKLQDQARERSIQGFETVLAGFRARLGIEAPATGEPAEAPEQAAADAAKAPHAAGKPKEATSWIGAKKDAVVSWSKEHLDVTQWTPGQKAFAATATVGTIGLLAFWLWRTHKKQGEQGTRPAATAEKKGSHWWVWVPGIGLVLVGLYMGNKFLSKFDAYAKGMEVAQRKWEDAKAWGREHHPLKKKEKFGLETEAYKLAEAEYRKTRGVDLTEVRKIFDLKDGDANPDYEAFLKEMHGKYDTKQENGILYARADSAMENYEDQMKVAIRQIGHWAEQNSVAFSAAGLVLYKTHLLSIGSIARTAGTTAHVAKEIAEHLLKMGIRHPFITLLSAGGAFLAGSAAVSACKKLYLSENFTEAAKAFEGGKDIALGERTPAVNRCIQNLQDKASDLKVMVQDFATWVTASIGELGAQLLEKAPEAFGRKKEENNTVRNKSALDNLRQALETRELSTRFDTEAAKREDAKKYAHAMKMLDAFKSVFLANRCESMVPGSHVRTEFDALVTALGAVGIAITITDGIVRWKKENGTDVDLCVDPDITDPKRFHELSEKMREGEESSLDYIWFRWIQDLRERAQNGMEKAEGWRIPGGHCVAMAVGNMLYFVDPENQLDYWVAPITVVRELFSDHHWAEKGAEMGVAALNAIFVAGSVSVNMGALARIKRALIGGKPLAVRLSWKPHLGDINPFTCPLKTLRDVAGGVVDITTFIEGGREVNTVLARLPLGTSGRVGIRPQWIGIIANSTDERELLYVARQMGEVGLEGQPIAVIKTTLEKHIKEYMDLYWGPSWRAGGGKVRLNNANKIWDAAVQWYQTQGKVSRFAARTEKLCSQILHSPSAAWAAIANRLFAPRVPVTPATLEAKAWTKLLAKFGKKVTPGDVRALLELARDEKIFDINTKTLTLISESTRAQKIIAGAVDTADAAEVVRALKAAKIAAGFRIACNTVGAAGDLFGVYMAYADWQANGERIEQAKQTKNTELQKLYEHANLVYAAEGGGSAVGLVIGGVAVVMVAKSGGGVLAALGASGGVIMLPVAVATVSGGLYYRALEDVTATWLKNEADWARESEADLFAKLRTMAPGKQGYTQRAAWGTNAELLWRTLADTKAERDAWKEEGFQRVEDANTTTRSRITKALLLRTTSLPRGQGESEEAYARRLDEYVGLEHAYVLRASQGDFAGRESLYQGAHDFAALVTHARALKKAGRSEFLEWEEGGTMWRFNLAELETLAWSVPDEHGFTAQKVLAAYRRSLRDQKIAGLNVSKTMQAPKKARRDIAITLLSDLRYALIAFEGKLRAADLPGFGWTSGEEKSRMLIRMAVNWELKRRILGESARLLALPEITFDEHERSRIRVEGTFDESFEDYLEAQRKRGFAVPSVPPEQLTGIAAIYEQLEGELKRAA
ncbi:MAG: hypothetical protein V1926_05590 [Candidatus Peregrinibacteria bacterium]